MLITGTFATQAGSVETVSNTVVDVKTELAYPLVLKEKPSTNYIKVSLTGNQQESLEKRTPINISLVIDRSGSMQGNKIAKARDAALLAVDMLGADDIISIIGYDYSAEVIVPATKLTDKERVKQKIRNAIRANGNTALFAGVSKGIAEVNKFLNKNNVNRVILLSDGQANVGPSSSTELGELGISAAKQGIAVSTVGLGDGYNEDLMTTLAGYSDGNHFFVEYPQDLQTAFNQEFNDVMNVVAQNIEVKINVQHGKPVRLLGRNGKIHGNTVTVKLNQIYSNQEKYVLLEIAPTKENNQGEQTVAKVSINYLARGAKKPHSTEYAAKVLYSNSQKLVDKSANEDILADVFVQQSNNANALAIKSLDDGDAKSSNKTIQEAKASSYDFMSKLSSKSARDKVQKQIIQLDEAADAIQAEPATKARKVLKKNSYKTKKQQN
ncbi:MAG: VWA domain-containing protein [Gammaproteobacteria bacterium]|nr:VWA domain-containing protein [Gammaproteobacteria bacterium]